jgi:hypothetical protein
VASRSLSRTAIFFSAGVASHGFVSRLPDSRPASRTAVSEQGDPVNHTLCTPDTENFAPPTQPETLDRPQPGVSSATAPATADETAVEQIRTFVSPRRVTTNWATSGWTLLVVGSAVYVVVVVAVVTFYQFYWR